MPVVGMNFKKINVERIKELQSGLRINTDTKIIDVKETDMPGLGKKGASVGYEFKIDYVSDDEKTKFANVTIAGNVFYLEDGESKIVEMWNKDKKLPEQENLQVLNTVLRRCVVKSLGLAEDLQLPPPIALPMVTPKTEKREVA